MRTAQAGGRLNTCFDLISVSFRLTFSSLANDRNWLNAALPARRVSFRSTSESRHSGSPGFRYRGRNGRAHGQPFSSQVDPYATFHTSAHHHIFNAAN
jgi:hypothetical protein